MLKLFARQAVGPDAGGGVQGCAVGGGALRFGALPGALGGLFVIGAGQTQGWRRTALHPLGSLDDHAYVLSDAGVSTLIIDPVPMFVERAAALLERVPGLKQVLTLGPVPEQLAAHARDVIAEADNFEPKPLVAAHLSPDHVVSITYTGGTTGKPKGVIGTARAMSTMTQIQLAEWEWPEHPRFLLCTPLSHAGAAFFVPTLMKGGSMVVLSKFDPAEVLREAFSILERLRMEHQVQQMGAGRAPGDVLSIRRMSSLDRGLLEQCVREVAAVQRRMANLAQYLDAGEW